MADMLWNEIVVKGNEKDLQIFLEALKPSKKHKHIKFCQTLIPMPKELRYTKFPITLVSQEMFDTQKKVPYDMNITTRISDLLTIEYGYNNWYDWQEGNWGVGKGDSSGRVECISTNEEITLTFDTPWGKEPDKALFTISKKYPTLEFRHANELSVNIYKNGKVIPENDTQISDMAIPQQEGVIHRFKMTIDITAKNEIEGRKFLANDIHGVSMGDILNSQKWELEIDTEYKDSIIPVYSTLRHQYPDAGQMVQWDNGSESFIGGYDPETQYWFAQGDENVGGSKEEDEIVWTPLLDLKSLAGPTNPDGSRVEVIAWADPIVENNGECPKCGDTDLEHADPIQDDGNVIYRYWVCKSCGHEFRQTFVLTEISNN